MASVWKLSFAPRRRLLVLLGEKACDVVLGRSRTTRASMQLWCRFSERESMQFRAFRVPQICGFGLIVFAQLFASSLYAENWPQWRGPQGTGVSSEKGLPIKWDASRSLIWKCPLPEWGTSTPAIWNDAIFITSHTADNKLVLLRIEAKTGKIAWTQEVGSGEAVREAPKRSTQKFHQLHNLASPS